MKHRAKMKVSYCILRDMLALPKDTEIIAAISEPYDQGREQVTFIIEHPDLPEWESPEEPATVVAEYQQRSIGNHELAPKFLRWV